MENVKKLTIHVQMIILAVNRRTPHNKPYSFLMKNSS